MVSIVYYKNKTNNTTYAYQNTSTWNKQTKKCNTQRKYLGKLDPTTETITPTNKKHKQTTTITNSQHATIKCQRPNNTTKQNHKQPQPTTPPTTNLPKQLTKNPHHHLLPNNRKQTPKPHTNMNHTPHPPLQQQPTTNKPTLSELLKTLQREKQLPFFTT